MSKLIDKLRRTTHATPRRMGFGAMSAQATPPTPVVLLAELGNLTKARAAAKAGADAICWQASSTADLSMLAESIKDTELPIGVALSSVAPDNWAGLGENGCDYVTVGLNSAARALDLQPLGVLLEVPLDTDDLLLRTLEQLPVDAVAISDVLDRQTGLTIQRLMSYQRLALLARRPVVLRVEAGLNAAELGLLRDAGIQALLVRADSDDGRSTLGALRQAIKDIPPRRRRREEHVEPYLPTPAPPSEPAHEEPEEEPFSPDLPDR